MTIRAPLSVAVLGLRGFPNIQGGVEKHAEQLYPRLAVLGCQIRVLGRSPYKSPEHTNSWENVAFDWLWTPEIRGLESLFHSIVAVIAAARRRPDLLHIHAIGPGLVAPLARLMGMKVVVTHHGKDYERQKWGPFAKKILRIGEHLAMKSAHERIVISEIIRDSVREMYGVESVVIPNGIEPTSAPQARTEVVSRFGLEPGRYVLQVSRLVPEKRQLDLIEAFVRAALPGWRLALVGDTEFPDAYSRFVKETAGKAESVVCTGFLAGEDLREIYRRAGMFVLPSSHEGLPIALLEAISYCVPVLASDIGPNRLVGLDSSRYFALGNVQQLSEKIRSTASSPPSDAELERVRDSVRARHDWDAIAQATLTVYQRALVT